MSIEYRAPTEAQTKAMVLEDEVREVLHYLPKEDLDFIVEGIRKQTPVGLHRVTMGTSYDELFCPSCRKHIQKKFECCPDCGQAFDWEETNKDPSK